MERFNRTIRQKIERYLTQNKTKTFINVLPELVESYNKTYHRSIQTAPIKVKQDNESEIRQILYKDQILKGIEFKFKRGDYVRCGMTKGTFQKGYLANWRDEVFIINQQIPTIPPTYKICDRNGKRFNDCYYEQELQKVIGYPFDSYVVIGQLDPEKYIVIKLNSESYKPEVVDKKFLEDE